MASCLVLQDQELRAQDPPEIHKDRIQLFECISPPGFNKMAFKFSYF